MSHFNTISDSSSFWQILYRPSCWSVIRRLLPCNGYNLFVHSTLEDLEDALISITNADETERAGLPQYDGPGDEDGEEAQPTGSYYQLYHCLRLPKLQVPFSNFFASVCDTLFSVSLKISLFLWLSMS